MIDNSGTLRLSDSHFHSGAIARRDIDIAGILTELIAGGAGPMLDVGIEPEDTEERAGLVGGIDGVYRSVGLHPSSTGRTDGDEVKRRISNELSSGAYVAVGETGLDWYRMYAPKEVQLDLFRFHLREANEHQLPVIVHNRDADEDCYRTIAEESPTAGGVMHCYSSGPEWVDRFVELGMYISFAGNVTFKNAGDLREAAQRVPEDRLLIETDAPFLAPHPFRGRDNHPGLLVHTLSVVSEVRGRSAEYIATLTSENLKRMIQV